ncbi:MAG: ComF family protein [Candidatus Omnitrophota bacterium]
MTQAIVTIAKNFMNLLYPMRCYACGKDLEALNKYGVCDDCVSRIRKNPAPFCRICGRPVEKSSCLCAECKRSAPFFDRAYSAYLYEGVLKELIHKFKYNGKIRLSRILSKHTADFIEDNGDIVKDIDIITCVPLQNNRLRERGFNQSRILAFNISERAGIPFADTLEKRVSTRHQNELSRDERLSNLKGAFAVRAEADIYGLAVLLIDDVMTTGATLSECSRALRDAGAKEVRCLTLARGVGN